MFSHALQGDWVQEPTLNAQESTDTIVLVTGVIYFYYTIIYIYSCKMLYIYIYIYYTYMCFNGNESMFFASERQPSQHKSFFGLLFAAAAQSFFLQTDAKRPFFWGAGQS